MRKVRAIIVDDEKHVRDAMELLLGQYCPEITLVGSAASAEEARELIKTRETDIIFLDIAMPREDGFDFLNSIPKDRYAIIFVTAYEEYALRALKAHAVDYLLKPVNPFELCDAVDHAIRILELRKNRGEVRAAFNESLDDLHRQIRSSSGLIEKITIAEQFGFRVVKVADLMYLEADSNYTILHLSGLDKIVATRSLGEFEHLLDQPMFFRIHKSTIVNLNYLKGYSSYQGNFAELTDGTRLSISRRKVNEFREAVARYSKSVG